MLKIVSALHHLYTGCVGAGLLSDANKCTLPYICEHSALECTHIAHVVCAGKHKQSCILTQHNEMPSILRAFHIAFSSSFPSFFTASSLLPFPISLLPPPCSLPSAFPISLLSLLPSPPLPFPISLLPPPCSLPSAFPISLLSLLLPSPPLPYILTSSSLLITLTYFLLAFPTSLLPPPSSSPSLPPTSSSLLLPSPSPSLPLRPPPSLPCIPSSSPSSPSCVHLSCPGL